MYFHFFSYNDKHLFGYRVFTNFIDLADYEKMGLDGVKFTACHQRCSWKRKNKLTSMENKQMEWMVKNNFIKADGPSEPSNSFYYSSVFYGSSSPSTPPYEQCSSQTSSDMSQDELSKSKTDRRRSKKDHSCSSTHRSSYKSSSSSNISKRQRNRSHSPKTRNRKRQYSSSSISSVDRSRSREREGNGREGNGSISSQSLSIPPRFSFDKSTDRWLLYSSEKGEWVPSDSPHTETAQDNVKTHEVTETDNDVLVDTEVCFSIAETLSRIRKDTMITEENKHRERKVQRRQQNEKQLQKERERSRTKKEKMQ